ncbi:MAG: serine hydrolase domain-containing protein [Candidatus Binataceae bacterium]
MAVTLIGGCFLHKPVVTDPSAVVGTWTTIAEVGNALGTTQTLHRIVHVWIDSAGKLQVSIDEVEEHIEGVRAINAQFKDGRFSYEVPGAGNYTGTLSLDQNTIDGTWDQFGVKVPSVLTRHIYGPLPTAMPTPTPAPAIPPVSLDHLKRILDREMVPVLAHGLLSPQSGGGLVIGVLDHGQRQIFAYGTVKAGSIFGIASITKTFTGLVLAQMVVQKKVALDEPIRTLLPPGFVAKPDGPEITLLDLATHYSGLPRDPDNVKPKSPKNPYADYDATQLRKFLDKHGVAKPAAAGFLYSNVGFGLLAYGLSVRAEKPYEQLLASEVLGPLQLKDTRISLSPQQRARLIQGYDTQFDPVGPLDLDVLAGTGAISSTADDMLTYLDANLHPEKYSRGAAAGSPAATLPAAVALDHQVRAQVGADVSIALAWLFDPKSQSYSHEGLTAGYGSLAQFTPERDRGIVVLYNRLEFSFGPMRFPQRVAENVSQLMSGKPSIPLDVLSDDDRASLNRPTPSH